MRLRLDCDVRVRDARRKELAERAQEKRHDGRDAASLFERILELLKERVLQDGVDDEDERGQHARKERLGAFIAQQRHQRAEGAGRVPLDRRLVAGGGGVICASGAGEDLLDLFALLDVMAFVFLNLVLARCHARVDDPDGVRDNDGCGAGNRAGDHGLDGGELLGDAGGILEGGGLEEGASPFVPVVVDKIGDGNAKEGRVKTGVEAAKTLALDNVAHGVEEGRVGALGFNLGAGREGDERVPGERESEND